MKARMLSSAEAVRLVAAREITVKLRDRTFLISTLFFLLVTAGSIILPAVFGGGGSSVAVVRQDTGNTLRGAGLDVQLVADERAAEHLVRDGEVDAAVVGAPNAYRVLALQEAPKDVVGALSSAPPVQLLDPSGVDPTLSFLIPMMFGMVVYITSLLFGLQIAQSVVEEKQTRIVEILVSTVPVRALLAGKVLAGTVLAMGQIALIAVTAVVGLQLAGSNSTLLSLLAPAIGWFIPFFVVGFVLQAGMWAATGALASRAEDLSNTTAPMQMLVLAPLFAVIYLHDNPVAMTVLSYLPFCAPTAMPLRLFTGDAAWWEPVLSLAILFAAAAALLTISARLYEGSLLQTNGRTGWHTAWRQREVLGSASRG